MLSWEFIIGCDCVLKENLKNWKFWDHKLLKGIVIRDSKHSIKIKYFWNSKSIKASVIWVKKASKFKLFIGE